MGANAREDFMKRIIRKTLFIVALVLLAAIVALVVIGGPKSKKSAVESVSISGNTEYYLDEFDPSQIKLQLNYTDGTKELLPLTEGTVTGELLGSLGTHTVSVTYKWYEEATFTYTVKNRTFADYSFKGATVTYNGASHSIAPTNLPEGTKVLYVVDGERVEAAPEFKNVGKYTVTAILTHEHYDEKEIRSTVEITAKSISFSAIANRVNTAGSVLSSTDLTVGKTNLLRVFSESEYKVVPTLLGVIDGDDVTGVATAAPITALGNYTALVSLTGADAANYKLSVSTVSLNLVTDKYPMLTFKQSPYPDKVVVVENGAVMANVKYDAPIDQEGYELAWNWPAAFLTEDGKLNTSFVIQRDFNIDIARTAIEYTITYVGANVSDSAPTVYSKDDLAVFGTPLWTSLEEMGFEGWYTTSNFQDGTKVYDTSSLIGDVTLYAKMVDRKLIAAPGFTIGMDEENNVLLLTINKAYGSTSINLEYIFDVSEGCVWLLGDKEGDLFVQNYDRVIALNPGDNFRYVRVVDPSGVIPGYTEYKINVKVLTEAETADLTYTFVDANGEKYHEVFLSGTNDTANDVLDVPAENPAKIGYRFAGWECWDSQQDKWVPVTFDTTANEFIFNVTGGETFRPVYEIVEYDYTLDANIPERAPAGSMTDIADPNGIFTITTSVTLPVPSMKGYEFLGWFTAKTPAEGEEPVTGISEGTTENQIFYAQWKPIVYEISYDLVNTEYGKFEYANGLKYEYTIEDTFTIAKDGIVSRKGYTFLGWSTVSGSIADEVTEIVKGTTENIQLYAVWQANKNTITFSAGYTNESVSAEVLTDDEMKLTIAELFERNGYTFMGWTDQKNGSSVKYALNDPFVYTPTYVGKDVTFYAVWSANTYNLTFDLTGGTGSFQDMSGKTDGKVSIYSYKPEREHYDFLYWKDAEGNMYNPGASYTMPANGGKLTAQWQLHTYSVNYVVDGVTKSTEIKFTIDDLKDGKTISLADLKPNVNGGHTFIKWCSDTNLSLAKTEISESDAKNNTNVVIYPDFDRATEGLIYTLEDGYYVISGFNPSSQFSGLVEIPTTYGVGGKLYEVKAITESAFRKCETITAVNIAPTVQRIDANAFEDCTNLAVITVPESVVSIGSMAFKGCTALSQVIIEGGNQPLNIGSNAFENCTSLKSITLPSRVLVLDKFVFYGCDIKVTCEVASKPATWDTLWCVVDMELDITTGQFVGVVCEIVWKA